MVVKFLLRLFVLIFGVVCFIPYSAIWIAMFWILVPLFYITWTGSFDIDSWVDEMFKFNPFDILFTVPIDIVNKL